MNHWVVHMAELRHNPDMLKTMEKKGLVGPLLFIIQQGLKNRHLMRCKYDIIAMMMLRSSNQKAMIRVSKEKIGL